MMQEPVYERIRQDLAKNDVVLYMKGSPVFPLDGFSAAIVQVLESLGVQYKDNDVLVDPGLHEGLKDFAKWPNVPQLYIKGQFIGGCDAVREMYASGELQQLLQKHHLIP
jgi:monothiol glutaredoxin